MTLKKKYNILLVDDDTFLLGMYASKFGKIGMNVEIAGNAQEAFAKLKDGFKPDIMLLDVIMPGIDGLEFYEKVKKDNLTPDTIVIMLTNQGGSVDIERAQKLNVAGYIVKATTIPSEVVEEVLKIVELNKK